jgi:hypothetical protein
MQGQLSKQLGLCFPREKGKLSFNVGRGRLSGHCSIPVFLHVVYSCEGVIFVFMQTMRSKSGSGSVMRIILGDLLL